MCGSDPLVCFPPNVTMTISACRASGMSQSNKDAFASILGVYDFSYLGPPSFISGLEYSHTGNTAGIFVYGLDSSGYASVAKLSYSCPNYVTGAYGIGHLRYYASLLIFELAQPTLWPNGNSTASVSFMGTVIPGPQTIGSICGGSPTIWNNCQGTYGGGPPRGTSVVYDFTIEIGLP